VSSLLFFKKTTAMAHDGWPHATAMAHGGCKVAACRCGFPATAVGHDVCQTAVGHDDWLSKLKNFETVV
jgi:hypothetical protein